MSNPTGRDVGKVWIVVLSLTAGMLTLAFCTEAEAQKLCDPNDPLKCVQPLQKGDVAPFDGQLLSPRLAATQAVEAHQCKDRIALAVDEAGELAKVKLDASERFRAIDARAALEREELLKNRLQEAIEAAQTRWWELPEVWLGIGLVVGVAATVGALEGGIAVVKASR